eukprot:CAMPEP_0206835048 /NCGR_PEP_ID=MMETSP0975-20121206/19200_1 /ASSEMBLY_ACC=CAM_ASM_000399 /TAXON_ID=483370 /ORGANISM="non described non described, Strain CCMP2097" /LENGTH=74 /DNA_ID=CAMNT_0054377445 /DNA_START=37 /DNA_END=258 /DNA_ORIENTATION=+
MVKASNFAIPNEQMATKPEAVSVPLAPNLAVTAVEKSERTTTPYPSIKTTLTGGIGAFGIAKTSGTALAFKRMS